MTDNDTRDSIDAEAQRLLSDIQNTSSFVLRAELAGVEDIDPNDIAPARPTVATVAEEEALPLAGAAEADAGAGQVDEASKVITSEMENAILEQEAQVAADKEAVARRGRLSHTLIAVIVILVLAAAAVIGFVIYINLNASPSDNAATSDSTQLAASNESSQTTFTAVDTGCMAKIASFYGMTVDEIRSEVSGQLVIDDSLEKADKDVPLTSIKYWADATFIDDSGDMTGSCIMGLNRDKELVYSYSSFDLDALNVADADFAELASDGTVAASVLAGLGVSESAIQADELTTSELPNAVDDVQTIKFSGETGLDGDPQTWELSVSYDKSVGKTIGDNSVIRTLVVELY